MGCRFENNLLSILMEVKVYLLGILRKRKFTSENSFLWEDEKILKYLSRSKKNKNHNNHPHGWGKQPLKDGGRFHTVYSSTTKAVCAASNRRPTTTRGAQAQELDTLHALGLSLAAGPQRWTAIEGGFPIFIESQCVGGIGVSGGDWKQDEEIARAAVEAVGANIGDA